jgi:putative membrane protein
MGGADVIPGVSGGTVALIVGIYERLVASIRALATVPVALVRGDTARARRELSGVEWSFLLPLGGGIAGAIALGSLLIPPLRARYPIEMRAVFLGLVAGALPLLWRRIGSVGWREVAIGAVAAVAAFWLVGLPHRELGDPHLLVVAGAAAVAICAMILPGVSGAFLLEAMGLYDPTLAALRAGDVAYVGVFVLGAAVGLGSFARILGHLLERRHDLTMAALIGLVVGALRALWPWLDADRGLALPPGELSALWTAALALAGLLTVLGLTRAGATRARERV